MSEDPSTKGLKSGESEQFVAAAFEAWNAGDLEAFIETLDPEVEWRTAGIFPGLESEYRGREQVREFWQAFHDPWERLRISYDEMIETAPDEVLLHVLFSGVGRAGIEAEMAFGQHYVLRDGLMTRMRSFKTWELAAAAALPAEAVIFDNDGLLLDTESVWTRGEQDLFESRGLEFTLEHKQELVGTSAQVAAGILEQRLGEPGRAAEIMVELDDLVMAELRNGVEAMVGARELVGELRGEGIPLALVSNSPRAFIELALESAGMDGAFGVVVSAHEVAAPKPDPEPYLEACRLLGVKAGPAGRRAGGLPDRGRLGPRRRPQRGRRALGPRGRAARGPPQRRLARGCPGARAAGPGGVRAR